MATRKTVVIRVQASLAAGAASKVGAPCRVIVEWDPPYVVRREGSVASLCAAAESLICTGVPPVGRRRFLARMPSADEASNVVEVTTGQEKA